MSDEPEDNRPLYHVDVRPRPGVPGDVQVQVSVDGAPWHTLMNGIPTIGDPPDRCRADCEAWARAFVHGLRFAGCRVRTTSHGYNL